MRLDAAGRRSVRITHRNLDRVLLRAYALDLEAEIKAAQDYNLFPQGDEAREIVAKRKPDAAWKADLPKTPDYRDHRTYANLPESLAPGLYLVVASVREDFREDGQQGRRGRRHRRRPRPGQAPGRRRRPYRDCPRSKRRRAPARRSRSPHPLRRHRPSRRRGHGRPLRLQLAQRPRQDRDEGDRRRRPGLVRPARPRRLVLPPGQEGPGHRHRRRRLLPRQERPSPGKRGPRSSTPTARSTAPARRSTGRSWPTRAARTSAASRPKPDARSRVWLEDINDQRVAEATVSTNAFGTASGEFVIPATGRPLGGWRLRSTPTATPRSASRNTSGRPSKSPSKTRRSPCASTSPRRSRAKPAITSGSPSPAARRSGRSSASRSTRAGGGGAGGSPAAAAARPSPAAGPRSTPTARSPSTFTPRADERKDAASSGLSYRYTLSVDVTDEGGETRSASRSFRLGFVSVEARPHRTPSS